MSRSARHRSHKSLGLGDELRVSLVSDGIHWGGASFPRNDDEPEFTGADVHTVASLSAPVADGLRRTILKHVTDVQRDTDYGPGVIVFDAAGEMESISPAAEHMDRRDGRIPDAGDPRGVKDGPGDRGEVREFDPGTDPLELAARARVRA